MMVRIGTLLDTRPDEIPKDSQSLLKFNHMRLARFNIHNKAYGVVTMEAALIARQRTSAKGARHRRMYNKHCVNMTRRARLGIHEAEKTIRLDRST